MASASAPAAAAPAAAPPAAAPAAAEPEAPKQTPMETESQDALTQQYEALQSILNDQRLDTEKRRHAGLALAAVLKKIEEAQKSAEELERQNAELRKQTEKAQQGEQHAADMFVNSIGAILSLAGGMSDAERTQVQKAVQENAGLAYSLNSKLVQASARIKELSERAERSNTVMTETVVGGATEAFRRIMQGGYTNDHGARRPAAAAAAAEPVNASAAAGGSGAAAAPAAAAPKSKIFGLYDPADEHPLYQTAKRLRGQ